MTLSEIIDESVQSNLIYLQIHKAVINTHPKMEKLIIKYVRVCEDIYYPETVIKML